MPRCPDAPMPRCPDAPMPRCPDARMQGCKDARMQGCPQRVLAPPLLTRRRNAAMTMTIAGNVLAGARGAKILLARDARTGRCAAPRTNGKRARMDGAHEWTGREQRIPADVAPRTSSPTPCATPVDPRPARPSPHAAHPHKARTPIHPAAPAPAELTAPPMRMRMGTRMRFPALRTAAPGHGHARCPLPPPAFVPVAPGPGAIPAGTMDPRPCTTPPP
jgi:hypothetical protein